MKRVFSLWSFFGLLIALRMSSAVRAEDRTVTKAAQPAAADRAATKPRVPFTISKETTYIVESLDKDGYPDYVAALNRHYGKGVTPENNAAVPFWRAMGPSLLACPKEWREKYFKLLGIEAVPEKGDYFVTEDEFAKRLVDAARQSGKKADESVENAFYDDLTKAMRQPWSSKELPQVAAWLAINERALALFTEASNRPRRFDPLPDGNWIQSLVSFDEISPYRYLLRCRPCTYYYAVRTLTARAMLRLGDGRVDDAWKDLLACHRLARLVAEGPSFIEYGAATSLQETTWRAERGMLAQTRLSAAQIAKMRDDVERLPRMPEVAEKIDIGNRSEYLHTVCWMSKYYLPSLAATPEQEALLKSLPLKPGDIADWDVMFRKGNAIVDRVVAVTRHGTPAERIALKREMKLRSEEGVRKMQANVARIRKALDDAPKDADVRDVLKMTTIEAVEKRKADSEGLADYLCYLIIGPSCTNRDYEDQGRMRFELTKLAIALAAYREDHGEFPVKLADLTPKCVSQIPKDGFSGADLHYSLQEGGYLLYSIGPNRHDDGGKGIDDRPQEIKLPNGVSVQRFEDWDDIAVRITSAK